MATANIITSIVRVTWSTTLPACDGYRLVVADTQYNSISIYLPARADIGLLRIVKPYAANTVSIYLNGTDTCNGHAGPIILPARMTALTLFPGTAQVLALKRKRIA